MYAVIETGGKQYRVEVGTELEVELLDVEAGESMKFDRVLLVADGETAAIGRPVVANAEVDATILGRDRGVKTISFKYRPKARRRVKKGHRQELTLLRISDIVLAGHSAAADVAQEEAARKRDRSKLEEAARRQAAADAELAAKLAAEKPVEKAAKATPAKATPAKAAPKSTKAAPARSTTAAKPAKAATAAKSPTKATAAKASAAKATAAKATPAKVSSKAPTKTAAAPRTTAKKSAPASKTPAKAPAKRTTKKES
jgi:large subunit ribosomal protein L21